MNQIIITAIISSIVTVLVIRYIDYKKSDGGYIYYKFDENSIKERANEMKRMCIFVGISLFTMIVFLKWYVLHI